MVICLEAQAVTAADLGQEHGIQVRSGHCCCCCCCHPQLLGDGDHAVYTCASASPRQLIQFLAIWSRTLHHSVFPVHYDIKPASF